MPSDFPPVDFDSLTAGGITPEEVQTILGTFGIGRKSPESQNLDTLFTPGLYDVDANAVSVPLSNNSGTVLVMAGGSGGFTQLWQRANTLSRNRIYHRHYQGSSWSAWTEILDESFKADSTSAIDATNNTDYMTPQATRQHLQAFGIGTEWSDLAGSYTYGFKTQYQGSEYAVGVPVPAAELAPPTSAGRTFTEFDGVNDYISIPTINLVAGDIVRFKFLAPTEIVPVRQFLLDNDNVQNRFAIQFTTAGRLISSGGFTQILLDGQSVPDNTPYPTDGLVHTFELTKDATVAELANIGNRFDGVEEYQGRIYDLEVIRGGNRIHYYPLRSDAVDYLAGNLVADEEFTYSGNFSTFGNVVIENNSVVFPNNSGQNAFGVSVSLLENATYRMLADVDLTSGTIAFGPLNGPNVENVLTIDSSGKQDFIFIKTGAVNLNSIGFSETSFDFLGTIKNFRVIPMNELSPSANFTNATGFRLIGSATITGGQAVFDGSAGTNTVRPLIISEGGDFPELPAGTIVRVVGNATITSGSINIYSRRTNGITELITALAATGSFDVTHTLLSDSSSIGLFTDDAGAGNIDFLSITEVTDGTENGSPAHNFEYYWREAFIATPVGTELTSFTIATLPSAAANARVPIFISDLAGQAAPAFSDGVTWRRYSDNTEVN